MRTTKSPYDSTWAIAQIRAVWEWAERSERHYVAFLLGMAILAFEHDDGTGRFNPKSASFGEAPPRPKRR